MRVIGCFGAVVGAFAGEAELAVERGRVAYDWEDYAQARDQAVEALAAAPSLEAAHRLYADAVTAAGLGARVVSDLDPSVVVAPPYAADARELTALVESGDTKAIKAAVWSLRAEWPASPAVLRPLWTTELSKVVKLRGAIVEDLTSPEQLAAADAETLFATSRLLREVGADEARATCDATLVQRGERPAPSHVLLGRLERMDLALQLSKAPLTELPIGLPSEITDVVTRLDEIWTKAGKHRDIAAAWRLVQVVTDDPAAWTAAAQALLRGGDHDAALVAAHAAVHRAAGPRAIDLGASNAERQRHDLAAALLARARVGEGKGLIIEATVDLATAHLLAGRTVDDKLGERLETAGAAFQKTLSQKWSVKRGTSTEAALSAASTTPDPDKRRAIVTEALFMAAASSDGTTSLARTPEPYLDVWTRAHLIVAAGDEAASRVETARTAAVVGTLLAGPALHPHGWARRGALHQKVGEPDAAFVALAVARGHGVPALDDTLGAAYVGPGHWLKAADAVGGPPSSAVAAAESLAPAPRTGSGRRAPPAVGNKFPSFSVSTQYGTLSNSTLTGRVAVISFFEASCGECLQMLPALGRLARTLRAEGRDVVVIGVSTDEDPAAFDDVFRVGEHWAELVHSPALGQKAGVERVPTTWVVDAEGIARYGVDHWVPNAAIEAKVRELVK